MNRAMRAKIIIVSIFSIGLVIGIFVVDRAPDKEKSARLVRAIQLREDEVIDRLLHDLDYDINKQNHRVIGAEGPVGDTPFIVACRAGNVKVVDSYIKRGGRIHPQPYHMKWTPLASALNPYDNTDLDDTYRIVKMLIDAGEDASAREDDWPMCMYAATLSPCRASDGLAVVGGELHFDEYRYSPVAAKTIVNIYKLVSKYDNMNTVVDESGRTPLEGAVSTSNRILVDYLISEEHYDVNARDENGQTALFTAVSFAEREEGLPIIMLLLENGANKDLKDVAGETAYDVAIKLGETEISELLRPERRH
jgi:ankyrin repeat protein